MNWLIRKVRLNDAHLILISFFIFILPSCTSSSTPAIVSIAWKNSKAVAIGIPVSLIKGPSSELKVQLMDGSATDVLGQIRNEGDTIFFDPFVPLTRGLHYKVLSGTTTIAEVEIPVSDSPTPQLLSIYPTQDTVPENLLKIYLKFSQPMEEGRSLSHILLLRNEDTLKRTFLDLQPELWNDEGTILTLWLDPGRVKRDLIPNKELGAPLKSGENYLLIVDDRWRSKAGKPAAEVRKRLIVASRDEKSSTPELWELSEPRAGTNEPLVINFDEPLDFSLASESIFVVSKNNDPVRGSIELMAGETQWKFFPANPWIKGNYLIKIESRLEDLAGNNLNRVFDRDLTQKSTKVEKDFYEKPFTIR